MTLYIHTYLQENFSKTKKKRNDGKKIEVSPSALLINSMTLDTSYYNIVLYVI